MFLGIDVGTSGVKVILMEADGSILAKATVEYPLSTPKPLWSEQNPNDWWAATIEGIKDVLSTGGTHPKEIAAIGLTGQMHGLVTLDSDGNTIRPCILWNDQRTSKECKEVTDRIGMAELIRITGKPILPSFTAPKILWMQKHERNLYEGISHVLLPKDFIRYKLTDTFYSDVSDASGTSFFDVGRRDWSVELLKEMSIPISWLPEVSESSTITSYISTDAAKATGLVAGTPVVAGAGDQAAEAVGCGIVSDGSLSVTIGTSGVVFAAMDNYRPDAQGRIHAYCHALPNRWHLMGVMLSAGGSLRWFRDVFCDEDKRESMERQLDPYEVMSEKAASVRAGCDGLLFLPYLTGERTPYADPYARGVFFGATLRHEKSHFIRAVMEGVAFGLKDSIELMRLLNVPMKHIRLSGGGARSVFWRQILADVFGLAIHTVNVTEGAAYGAAILAGVGAGAYESTAKAIEKITRDTSATFPSSEKLYEKSYHRYQSLYQSVRDEFRSIQDESPYT